MPIGSRCSLWHWRNQVSFFRFPSSHGCWNRPSTLLVAALHPHLLHIAISIHTHFIVLLPNRFLAATGLLHLILLIQAFHPFLLKKVSSTKLIWRRAPKARPRQLLKIVLLVTIIILFSPYTPSLALCDFLIKYLRLNKCCNPPSLLILVSTVPHYILQLWLNVLARRIGPCPLWFEPLGRLTQRPLLIRQQRLRRKCLRIAILIDSRLLAMVAQGLWVLYFWDGAGLAAWALRDDGWYDGLRVWQFVFELW